MPIAFVASGSEASVGNPASPVTFAYSVNASTNMLVFGIQTNNNSVAGAQVTGVTYNGVSMTNITGSPLTIDSFGALYFFALANPATGSNNFSIAFNNAGDTGFNGGFVIGEYSGMDSTIQPDSTTTASVASGTSITATTTTIADNTWLVCMFELFAASTAGANTTKRTQVNVNGVTLSDSNAAQTPAGSKSLNMTRTGNGNLKAIMASFAPSAAASVNKSKFLLLGVM